MFCAGEQGLSPLPLLWRDAQRERPTGTRRLHRVALSGNQVQRGRVAVSLRRCGVGAVVHQLAVAPPNLPAVLVGALGRRAPAGFFMVLVYS